MTHCEFEIPKRYMIYWIIWGTVRDVTWLNGFDVYFGTRKHFGVKWIKTFFFVIQVLKSKMSVFQTRDNGVSRQKVRLNPSLVLYFGSYKNYYLYYRIWQPVSTACVYSLCLQADMGRNFSLYVNCASPKTILTHSHIMTPFDAPRKQSFWKPCGKRGNCS